MSCRQGQATNSHFAHGQLMATHLVEVLSPSPVKALLTVRDVVWRFGNCDKPSKEFGGPEP